jgi:transcriptional regulator with XRE-family HTH domain
MSKIPPPPSIGKNVKQERSEQKLSLEELSVKSGVSKAMLSQIESSKVNPTVATMWKIAHGLGVDFNALLRGESEKIKLFDVVRHEDMTVLATDNPGVHIKILSSGAMADELELYMIYIDEGSALISQAHAPNTEEFLTILNGEVEVKAGANSILLSKGDVLRYESDMHHKITNMSNEIAEVYMVVRFNVK